MSTRRRATRAIWVVLIGGPFLWFRTGSLLFVLTAISSMLPFFLVPWLGPWRETIDSKLDKMADKLSKAQRILLGLIVLVVWLVMAVVAIEQLQDAEVFGRRVIAPAAAFGGMIGILCAAMTQTNFEKKFLS